MSLRATTAYKWGLCLYIISMGTTYKGNGQLSTALLLWWWANDEQLVFVVGGGWCGGHS
jgi:hypothetical protein